MELPPDASFAETYNYAFDYYKKIPRKDLAIEVRELQKQKQNLPKRMYDPRLEATLFAAKDQYHLRFRGRPSKDGGIKNIVDKGVRRTGGRTASLRPDSSPRAVVEQVRSQEDS